VERGKNRTKSSVRAKVEHPFHVIKRVFGFVKVRYGGLAKNRERLWVTCGLANLFMVRRRLLRAYRRSVSAMKLPRRTWRQIRCGTIAPCTTDLPR
jgi:hypothetical protein